MVLSTVPSPCTFCRTPISVVLHIITVPLISTFTVTTTVVSDTCRARKHLEGINLSLGSVPKWIIYVIELPRCTRNVTLLGMQVLIPTCERLTNAIIGIDGPILRQCLTRVRRIQLLKGVHRWSLLYVPIVVLQLVPACLQPVPVRLQPTLETPLPVHKSDTWVQLILVR